MIRRKEQVPMTFIKIRPDQTQVPPGDTELSPGELPPAMLPDIALCFWYYGAKGQLGFTMQFFFLILERSGSGRRGNSGFLFSHLESVCEANDQSQPRFLPYSGTSDRRLNGVPSLGSGGGETHVPSGLSSYGNGTCGSFQSVSCTPGFFQPPNSMPNSWQKTRKKQRRYRDLAFKHGFQRRRARRTVRIVCLQKVQQDRLEI